jgi:NitT/TauT family transport system substrate-binding protein
MRNAILFLDRLLAPWCVLLVVTLLAGGCDGRRPGGETPKATSHTPTAVRLQLNWLPEPEFGGIYAAELAGDFLSEGLQVEIIKGGPGVAAPQLAASGSVEFAVVGGEQIVTLREQGGELVALYAIYQDDPMGVMVHDSNPAQSLEALWRSQVTFACETNLSWVKTLAKRYGPSSATFVPHGASLVEFASDKNRAQQCFVFSEPIALQLQGVPTRVFLSKESGFNAYNSVVAASASYVAEHGDACARLVRALQKGWRRYLDDPGAANAHMASLNTAMSKEAMDLAAKRQAPLIENDDTASLGLGGMTEARWSDIVGQLRTLESIRSAPAASELFRWSAPPPRSQS